MEEPTISGVDTTMVESEEKLLVAAEQEMVVGTALPADIPPAQTDGAGSFGIMASLIKETFLESMQVPLGEPKDIATTSGTAPELPAPGSADAPALIVLPIL